MGVRDGMRLVYGIYGAILVLAYITGPLAALFYIPAQAPTMERTLIQFAILLFLVPLWYGVGYGIYTEIDVDLYSYLGPRNV